LALAAGITENLALREILIPAGLQDLSAAGILAQSEISVQFEAGRTEMVDGCRLMGQSDQCYPQSGPEEGSLFGRIGS
jgi:hypothetical protein